MNKIDHFVFFHPNLEEGIEYIKNLIGIKAEIGGQHLGRGTWNAIFSLGNDCYFEIISPDPKQLTFESARWMGVDNFKTPQFIRWAASVTNLQETLEQAKKRGLVLGEIQEGSRKLGDGNTLKWQLTEPSMSEEIEPVPFLIKWTGAVHPSKGREVQATLHKLILSHPDADLLKQQLSWLALNIEFIKAEKPKISVELDTLVGKVIIH